MRSRSVRSRPAAATSPTSTPTSTSTPPGCPCSWREPTKPELDFAIGSKRHPDSEVHYPRRRRVYSWLYQQLVRAPLPARRPRHAGRAQGLPARGRRAGAAAAARQAVRVRSRAARGRARARLRQGRGAADPARLPFTGSGVNPLAVGRALSTPPRSSTASGFCATTSGSARSPAPSAGRGRASTAAGVGRDDGPRATSPRSTGPRSRCCKSESGSPAARSGGGAGRTR